MYKTSLKLVATFSLMILMSFNLPPKKIKIYLIGDSTAANKRPKAYPETGWGMELQSFFNSSVTVDNRAMDGRSTKSFINEKRWQPIVDSLKPGDYVLIEFGHNDEKIDKPTIGTSLEEYKANLVRYVNESRVKKAIPILLTPIVRRYFKKGILTDTHKGYPDVVRKVADSLKVPLIDMQRKTEKLVGGLGDEASKKLFNYVDSGYVNYPAGKKDNTHLNPEGAKAVAGLVAEGISALHLDLAKRLL